MRGLLAGIMATYRHLPASVYVLFWASVVLSFDNFVFPFLTLYLTRELGLAEDRVGLVMGAAMVSCLVGTSTGGLLADRCSRKRVLLWSMLLPSGAYAVVPLVESRSAACLLIIAAMAMMAAARPAHDALVADFTLNA